MKHRQSYPLAKRSRPARSKKRQSNQVTAKVKTPRVEVEVSAPTSGEVIETVAAVAAVGTGFGLLAYAGVRWIDYRHEQRLAALRLQEAQAWQQLTYDPERLLSFGLLP